MIKIEVQKYVNGKGEKRAKIVGVEGMLTKSELPTLYTEYEPCTWLDGDKIEHTENVSSLNIGWGYSYEEIVRMIEQLKKCGEHLHEVNLQIAEDKKTWPKTEIFLI
ncbi:MAG: hypothetical protein PHH85_09120 [Candidatus Methanoperedens sp.]|nr:hypothetical protein [Candidatus Methanoperedens sp.]